MKNFIRPTSHAELRNHPEMVRTFSNLADFSDNELPSLFITNISFNPSNLDHLRADLAFVTSLVSFPFCFEGYVEVMCDTPAELLYECYCHFLGEGLDEPECVEEINRVRALFIEAGLPVPEIEEA